MAQVEDRLPRLHIFLHEWGEGGVDLVEFKALDDPGVGHTIEGLLLVAVVVVVIIIIIVIIIMMMMMKCGRYSHSKGF